MAVDQWLSEWGVTIFVGGLIAFMTFIMWDLAKKSNAGKFGTAIIFFALGLGVLGFVIKYAVMAGMEAAKT